MTAPLLALLLALPGAAAAQAVSEEELFSSPELQVQAAAPEAAEADKKSAGFSGDLVTVGQDIISSTGAPSRLDSFFVGNFMLDVRLKRGYKAYANLETSHYSSTGETDHALREAFVDFNAGKKVYFRAGKQVLQWGRCALWNPTDLVNIEKTPFIRKIGAREGSSGLKVHAPFGAAYNLYAFIDAGRAGEDREIAGALKFELLAGRSEMAFSGWTRRGRSPVFGYDLSSRLGDVDIAAEAAVAGRDNAVYVREAGGALYSYRKGDRWPLKAALNLRKGYRLGEFNDRLTLAAELFYNETGYAATPFRDRASYAFTGPLAALAPAGTRAAYMAAYGLYEPNYLGRRYAALFGTVTRFILSDMSLNLNYVRNLDDRSGAVTAAVNYADLNDFSAGFLATVFAGPDRSEYTYAGVRSLLQLTAGVSF